MMNLNDSEAGDLPIEKKRSGVDPIRPVMRGVGGQAEIMLDDSDLREGAQGDGDGEGAGEGPGRANGSVDIDAIEDASLSGILSKSAQKPLRRKISRIEERNRISAMLRIDRQSEEEKVETIINDLNSNGSSLKKDERIPSARKSISPGRVSPVPVSPGRVSPNSQVSRGRVSPNSQMNRVDELSPGRTSLAYEKPVTEFPRKRQLGSKNRVSPGLDGDGLEEAVDGTVGKPSGKIIQIKPKPHSTQLLSVNSETLSENVQKRPSIDLHFIEKFYHEGIYEFSEPEIEYNEVSPSWFNVENQRFEEEAIKDQSEVLGYDATRTTPFKQFHIEELKKDFD